jgi:hypothetical protein
VLSVYKRTSFFTFAWFIYPGTNYVNIQLISLVGESENCCKRDCPGRLIGLKTASIDRSSLKGEASRFSADFAHPFSCERPFKCQHHLKQDLGYVKAISNYYTYLR